ncbi:LytR/AlgR family response regulator transcription factor [Melioribacter sp. OK-6-Me]|uniref:LytR/AlgR family response regulator transcription factor n=1 Tax=unclassified Melioribacter TaxID=2627329 RepID=UPI003ED8D212
MKKIVVLEDDKVLCESIKSALSLNDFEVFISYDSFKGLSLIKEVKPDIILCDIMMPEYDGYWVIEKVRSLEEFRNIPFIFITAKSERESFRKGMEMGADDYLTKPFKISELIKAIEVQLKKKTNYKENRLTLEDFLFVDAGNKIVKVMVKSIVVIEADNIYSIITTSDGNKYNIRKSMSNWEEILPSHFARVHRGVIINLNYVKQIEKLSDQTRIFNLEGYDRPVRIGKSYWADLKGKVIK